MSTSPATLTEVADRVWVARHPWFDVSTTVVGGERGLVVVDTHVSTRVGRELVESTTLQCRAYIHLMMARPGQEGLYESKRY